MILRPTLWGAAVAAGLALAGCGDDRANYAPPDATRSYRPAAPPVPALPPVTPTAADDDPLVAPDPLASGGDSLGDAPTPDEAPAHADDDPLAAPGRPMPTDHSHWLHGSIFNARVAVSLNGLPLGEFRAPVDRDITMKLRRGINTVTFTYAPQPGAASAHLNVLESEHTPPVPPLVTFSQSPQTAGAPDGVAKAPAPIKQTFTFLAR